jgi:peptidoglycan hydrolase-like protein with peptidoglycan-binding domain
MMRTFVLGLALAVGLSVTPTFAASGSDRTRDAQQALKDKGYDPGPIDGIVGPETRAATKKYQEANHLTADGRLNATVMDSLGLHGHTAGGRMDAAGSDVKHSYSKGGSDVKQGGEKLGTDVKNGEYVDGAKDFGKKFGKGVAKMATGTAKATVNAAKGTKDAVTPK